MSLDRHSCWWPLPLGCKLCTPVCGDTCSHVYKEIVAYASGHSALAFRKIKFMILSSVRTHYKAWQIKCHAIIIIITRHKVTFVWPSSAVAHVRQVTGLPSLTSCTTNVLRASSSQTKGNIKSINQKVYLVDNVENIQHKVANMMFKYLVRKLNIDMDKKDRKDLMSLFGFSP